MSFYLALSTHSLFLLFSQHFEPHRLLLARHRQRTTRLIAVACAERLSQTTQHLNEQIRCTQRAVFVPRPAPIAVPPLCQEPTSPRPLVVKQTAKLARPSRFLRNVSSGRLKCSAAASYWERASSLANNPQEQPQPQILRTDGRSGRAKS